MHRHFLLIVVPTLFIAILLLQNNNVNAKNMVRRHQTIQNLKANIKANMEIPKKQLNKLFFETDICTAHLHEKLKAKITVLPIGEEPLPITMMRALAYDVMEAPGAVNIIGNRGVTLANRENVKNLMQFSDKFSDKLTLAWRSCDEVGNWIVYTARMTTLPGNEYRKQQYTEVLAPGQYSKTMCFEKKRLRLRQVTTMLKYEIRKKKQNQYYFKRSSKIMRHGVSIDGTYSKKEKRVINARKVGSYTKGASQIVPGKSFYGEVMPLIISSINKFKGTPLTLQDRRRCKKHRDVDCKMCTTYTLLNPVNKDMEKVFKTNKIKVKENVCKSPVVDSKQEDEKDMNIKEVPKAPCRMNKIPVTIKLSKTGKKLSSDDKPLTFKHSKSFFDILNSSPAKKSDGPLTFFASAKKSLFESTLFKNSYLLRTGDDDKTSDSVTSYFGGSTTATIPNPHVDKEEEEKEDEKKEEVDTKRQCRAWDTLYKTGKSWTDFDCSKSTNGHVRKLTDVCWTGNKGKKRIRYMWATFDGEPTNGYRTDCSGFVSAIWNVGLKMGGGYNTEALGDDCLTYVIKKEELMPGDILLNRRGYCKDKKLVDERDKNFGGHVTLFEKWANTKKNRYMGFEESSTKGAVNRWITYPYYSCCSPTCYEPRRFYKSCNATKKKPKECKA